MNQAKTNDTYQPTELLQLLNKKPIVNEKDSGKFIAFLNSCSERLSKGAPVQAIWDDYQAKDR